MTEPAPPRGDPEPPPSETPSKGRAPWGSIATGAILVLIGIGWLLQTTGALDVPWGALLPAGLILVGVTTMIAARSGSVGGLIALGIVLSVLTFVTAGLDVPLRGGIGERSEAPDTPAELRDRYELAIGQMRIDLTDLDLPPGTTEVRASVGMGELVVGLPPGTPARIEAEVSLGNVEALDRQESGFGPDVLIVDEDYEDADARLSIRMSVGMGSARVER